MDKLTGLPELEDGEFWRVTTETVSNQTYIPYYSRLRTTYETHYAVQIVRTTTVGRHIPRWSRKVRVVTDTYEKVVDSEKIDTPINGTLSEDSIREAANRLVRRRADAYARGTTNARLMGDYPPKVLG